MTPWLHYSPRAGWMNDPNGLVHRAGQHHLYYQYNPSGTAFANQHWGHATSPDLLNWTEREVALAPGPAGYHAPPSFPRSPLPPPAPPRPFLSTPLPPRR